MIHHYTELPSTNDEALRLAAAGAAHGTVVHALRQGAGRGRLGRPWSSPPGNLYVSVVLRPPPPSSRHAELGFVAALAVLDAVDAIVPTGVQASVKWPNDLLLEGAKLAGILLEGGGDGAIVAGFGVNIASAPTDLRYPATALALHGPATVDGTLAALLAALERWWAIWLRQGFPPIRTAWLARAPRPGHPIDVQQGDMRVQTGSAVGSMRNVALVALAKNMADELGPAGINVTVVHPGLTRTERTAPLVAWRSETQNVPQAQVEAAMASGNSVQRLIDAAEVADVVVFLCSPRSIAINGDVIAAGGGAPKAIHY